jgi:sulfur carrier protein
MLHWFRRKSRRRRRTSRGFSSGTAETRSLYCPVPGPEYRALFREGERPSVPIRATTSAPNMPPDSIEFVDSFEIIVNGAARQVTAGATVAQLLADLGLAGRRVAVERNRDIVPRARHADVRLQPGDRLELVTFVGGG